MNLPIIKLTINTHVFYEIATINCISANTLPHLLSRGINCLINP